MATLAHSSLTNSQLSRLAHRQRANWFAQAATTVGLRQERIRQRRALAQLSPRELADFGASAADVYWELRAPFWRAMPPC